VVEVRPFGGDGELFAAVGFETGHSAQCRRSGRDGGFCQVLSEISRFEVLMDRGPSLLARASILIRMFPAVRRRRVLEEPVLYYRGFCGRLRRPSRRGALENSRVGLRSESRPHLLGRLLCPLPE
jgi:hypothetical protein